MNFLWPWQHGRGVQAMWVRKRSSRHGPSWTLLKKPSPFLLPCTNTFNIIIIQTTHVCNLDFFLLCLCKHLHIQILFTLQHLLFFTVFSFCQNPDLYLTESPSPPLWPTLQPLLCQYLQSSPLALHFYPHLGSFLSKQFNWSQNRKCLVAHTGFVFSHWGGVF